MWIEDLQRLRREELIGGEIYFFPEIDSTNRKAHDLARQGLREGTVVMADSQSQGRGRMGRLWESPPGLNVYASVILRPAIPPSSASQLTLLAGVAAANSLAKASGMETRIKWPNDIFLHEKKVAGILSEMEAGRSGVRFVILGMGINVGWRKEDIPQDLRGVATSLLAEGAEGISRTAVAAAVFAELEQEYRFFVEQGFSPRLREEWNRLSWVNGKDVAVNGPEGEIRGRALGLDTDGALLILDGQGETHRFLAGDVSLRTTEKG